MNWMDIVVVAVLIITSIEGYIKGFIMSFIGIASWIIAGVCAMKFYKPTAEYIIANTSIYDKINDVIKDKFTLAASTPSGELNSDIFSFIKLPKIFESILIPPESSSVGNLIGNTVGEMVSKLMIDIISVILVFLAVKIILYIAAVILDKFAQLPVINLMNRLAGLLFGLLKGGIIISVVLALLVPIISIVPGDALAQTLEASIITEYLYDNNLLLKLIEGYF